VKLAFADTPQLESCSMLIVEDDLAAQEMLRDILSKQYPQLYISFSQDGVAGLALFKNLQPDIVLSDLKMPGLTGLEMATEIRRLAPQVPVIIITAHGDRDQIIHGIRIGISRYVLKPIELRQLFEAVDASLSLVKESQARRKAEDDLKKSEQRLRHALDAARLGSWEYDIGGDKMLWDQRCRAIFGSEEAAIVNYGATLTAVHPADRAEVWGAFHEAISGGEGAEYRKEHRVMMSGGEVRWVSSHGRMNVARPGGGGRRLIGVSMDITDRVRADQKIKESEARYRTLFTSLQEGVSLLEVVPDIADFKVAEVNPAFEAMAGETRHNLIGRNFCELFPDLNRPFLNRLSEVAQGGPPTTIDFNCKRWDRCIEAHLYAPIRGQVAIVYSDVTESKRLAEEREKNERLHSLGILAGGIAHDFNNILTAIAGNISLVKCNLAGAQYPLSRLEDCEKAVFKAASLTRQLLTFAKGGDPVRKAVAVAPLVREAISLFLSGTNSRARIELDDGLWNIHADPGQIQQALNNLVLNAVQAMEHGGVITVTASNLVVTSTSGDSLQPGRYVKITIADQGSGIPPELLSRIFDPYLTTKPTGSGLGLSSVYSILKRHDGVVTASSVPGEGARFEIVLPAGSENVPEEKGVELREMSLLNREILVMDDEEAIRLVVEGLLQEMGFGVTLCEDGSEAVARYRERFEKGAPFAAVILDLTVPTGMGGKDAAIQIRKLDPDAVLILASGYFSEVLSDWDGSTVVDAMVAKPYNLEQLSQQLNAVLAGQ
jgi:PAS domain S-box-containing protein